MSTNNWNIAPPPDRPLLVVLAFITFAAECLDHEGCRASVPEPPTLSAHECYDFCAPYYPKSWSPGMCECKPTPEEP
jgi:hypothetical protein